MMASPESSHHDPRAPCPIVSFGPQQQPLPNLAPLHRDQRSALPRGCRFRDLGEAHRNITGRSISAAHGANAIASSFASTTSSTLAASLSRDTTPSKATGTAALPKMIPAGDIISSPVSPCSADYHGDRSSLDDPSGNQTCSPANPDLSHLSTSPQMMTIGTNDTLVGRLYKQYQAHILNDRHGSQNSPTAGVSQADYSRDGATNRLGFHHDGFSSSPNSSSAAEPMSSPNVQPPQGEHTKELGSAEGDSPKAQGLYLTVPTRESLLYPKPLRVQSIRAEGNHASLRSGIAISATGMTTDSDDDPFRYDKDAYKIFLHPSKERDVSAALNHISGLSSHSRATLYSQEEGKATRKVSLRPPPIPKEYLDDDPFVSGAARARSPTPESADGFYDTSVIQPNWTVERAAYEVKVVLQDGSHNRSINTDRCSKIGSDHNTAAGKATRDSLSKPCQNGGMYHRGDKENMGVASERDDWETVATSAACLGSMALPHPVAGGIGIGSRGIKITGSSVADVSDDSSFCRVPFNEYASTDRIVQHPSGHEDSEESLQIRHISGTKIPVIVPKQRVHRVNGFAQNSTRIFPPSQRSGSDAAAALARKVSSPFRQLGGRRTHRFSPTPLQPLPFKLDKGKNRFEFRHYSEISDGDALCAENVYEFKGESSETGHPQSKTNNLKTTTEPNDGCDDDLSQRGSGSSQSSGDTVHSFPFPLIPLPEAARLQAVKRAVETDGPDSDPYWKGKEMAQKHIRVPARTHQRTPATFFASVFAPSSTQSSHQSNRLKKRRTIPKDLTMQSVISSTTGGGTWATILPFGSTSTRYAGPSHILKTAATRLHLDDIGRKFQHKKIPSFTIGSSMISRSNTPRLYPWDYQVRRRQRAQGTDPELRAIALAESENAMGRHPNDLERMGVLLDPEAFLSREARRRRRAWFRCMLAASMFPFISVLVYLGKFDSGLSWYTRGEVDRLSAGQRRTILAVMVLQCVLWPVILVLVVWRTQQLSGTH